MARHDYHLCITEITYNAETAAAEITVKIFTDDLERAIRMLHAHELRLGDARESADADELIFNYLSSHLQLVFDEKARDFTWVGKEVDNDATWCYLEITNLSKCQTLEITNRILTEVFVDQANMVHLKANSVTKSLVMTRNNLTGTITF